MSTYSLLSAYRLYQLLAKYFLRPMACLAARAISCSCFLLRMLIEKDFPWKKSLLMRIKMPKEQIAVVDGITFHFNFTNPLQRWVYFKCFEREDLMRLIGLVRKGDCCVDVGANFGTYGLYMGHATGPQGTVYSFEPRPEVYKDLNRNAALNPNIPLIPLPMGLSSTAGERDFFINPSNSDTGSVDQGDGKIPMGKLQFTTLDKFVQDRNIAHIRLIKVDVEGHEIDFLKGALNTIREGRVDFIQVEFASRYWKQRGVYLEDFEGEFKKLGCQLLPSKAYFLLKKDSLPGPDQTVNLLFSCGKAGA